MRFFTFIIAAFVFAPFVQAESLSSCQNACFENKKNCKTYTFNSCDHDLFTCRASCNSGKKQGSYSKVLPIDIAFQPILDLDR